jgi:hypothetical protein
VLSVLEGKNGSMLLGWGMRSKPLATCASPKDPGVLAHLSAVSVQMGSAGLISRLMAWKVTTEGGRKACFSSDSMLHQPVMQYHFLGRES